MWLVIFVVSLSSLQSLSLCRVHLFCVPGASLQQALHVHLPRALRLSLVRHQTHINLTKAVLQELESASTYEGALNLGLLMGNYCFFPHSEPKSHTFNSFILAGRRCFSRHLFIWGQPSQDLNSAYTRLPQGLYTSSLSICLVLNSFFVSSMWEFPLFLLSSDFFFFGHVVCTISIYL